MSNQFFTEIIEENNNNIVFQMKQGLNVADVVNKLKNEYPHIKEWIVKDMNTNVRYTSKNHYE